MKKLIKASSYTLATALVMVLSQSSALAAGSNANDSTLTFGQVIGGLAILVAVIIVPSIKTFRRVKA